MSGDAAPKIVTAAGVKRLEAERPQLNSTVDYTIEGEVETRVHSSLMAEREAAITRGWRALEKTSQKLSSDLPHAALAGRARVSFEARAEAKRAYLDPWRTTSPAAQTHRHPPKPNLKGDFMSDNDRNLPAETLREGPLKAAIWRNESEHGAYHSVTLARTYKDREGNLQDTSSFRAKDMLNLSELARRAHHTAHERDRAAYKEHQLAQSPQGPQQTTGHSR